MNFLYLQQQQSHFKNPIVGRKKSNNRIRKTPTSAGKKIKNHHSKIKNQKPKKTPLMLKNNKIILRDWQLTDLDAYQQWNTGQHLWMDYNGPYYATMTEAEVAQTIERKTANIISGEWETPRTNLVIADVNTDVFIGVVSWYWQSEETNWMSIGIVIYDDKQWGKGIGKIATALWVDYLFANIPEIVRLGMRTWSGHIGMMKVAEQLGFKEEARFRKARIVKGKYYDSIGLGILREEWERSGFVGDGIFVAGER